MIKFNEFNNALTVLHCRCTYAPDPIFYSEYYVVDAFLSTWGDGGSRGQDPELYDLEREELAYWYDLMLTSPSHHTQYGGHRSPTTGLGRMLRILFGNLISLSVRFF